MSASLHVVSAPAVSEIRELDKNIRQSVREYNLSFAHLAYYGWRLKLNDGFAELGYKNEHAYMLSLGIGKTWWFQAVAIGQALSSLPLSELEKIPVGQALLLLDVKPEIRTQFPWAQEAQADSFSQLARKIEDRNRIIPGPERVPMTPLSIRVPATAKGSIFRNLQEFKDRHNLSSIGQALEFAVADKIQDNSVLGDLNDAIRLIEGVYRSLGKRGGMEDERDWTHLALERVRSVYRKLLDVSREDDDEVHEEAVYETEDAGGDQKDPGRAGGLPEQHGRTHGIQAEIGGDVEEAEWGVPVVSPLL